jgi:alpha-galactosidase
MMTDEGAVMDNGRRRIIVQSLCSVACLSGVLPTILMRGKLKRKTENVIEAHHLKVALAAADFDNAAWNKARALSLERYWSGEEAPASRRAEARLLWSDEALHVRFVCHQSEPLIVSATPQKEKKTLGLWDRDVCEIFLAPDASRPTHYFEFEAAPTGEWVDLAILWKPEARDTNWDFHSGMTAAARIGSNSITIAMRIPWQALGRVPQAGERWRANLFRCVGADPTRGYLTWQPTRTEKPNFHVPSAFGEIEFG